MSGDSEAFAGYVVEAVRDLTGADTALWMMSDIEGERGRFLRVRACRGDFEEAFTRTTRIPLAPGSSITARAIIRTRPEVRRDLLDRTERPRKPKFYHMSLAKQYQWRSFMAVPLLGRQRQPLGSLNLYGKETAKFGESEVALMTRFARQVAIALENSQITERLNAQLQNLHQVGQAGTRQEELQLVARRLSDVFWGAPCAIRLYDSETKEFGERVAVGGVLDAPNQYDPRSGGASLYVVEVTKQPLYVEDPITKLPNGQTAIREELLDAGVKAVAYLPLLSGDEVIGILYVDLLTPYRFAQNDRLALELFASQAAVAIENARLYAELSLRVKQLGIILDNNERIITVGVEDVDLLLDLLYDVACEVMDLSDAQVQFAFYDEMKDEVTFPLAVEQDDAEEIDRIRWAKRELQYRTAVRAADEDEDGMVIQYSPRARRAPPGLTEYVIREKKPLLIEKDFRQRAEDLGIKVWPTFGINSRPTYCWLGVPMIVQGRVIGIISIQSLEYGTCI